jgi:pimeloyl-ACP methyl ester carboxylesterase
MFEAMGQDNSVYALDLPGYGLSERLPRAYTVADMCNAIKLVAQWISQQHPDQPLQVVGVSLSCEFVARVAQQSPGLFNTLALVSPTGFRGGRSLRQPEGSTLFMAGFDRFLRRPGPWWGRFLLSFLSGGLFSADIHNVYECLGLPVWVVHGTRGDFTDFRALDLVRDRPHWHVTVMQAGAMPYFEDIVTFMAEYKAFLVRLKPSTNDSLFGTF